MKKLALIALLSISSSIAFAETTYYSDGTFATTEGNTTYYSNGSTATTNGNTTYYSDGRFSTTN